jgi:uncharacterized protein YecA (UPF0149 family)
VHNDAQSAVPALPPNAHNDAQPQTPQICVNSRSFAENSSRPRVGRNEPCPCGSGKKYKRCCIEGKVRPEFVLPPK